MMAVSITDNLLKDKTPAIGVSVVIPAFNAAAHIDETLDSVFAQSYTDYEVIVVNDGSPDTPALDRALRPYADRLIYIEQENLGPSSARNAGILRASGEFVAFLDSDDVWSWNYLDEQMKALREDQSLDLIYADALLVGPGVRPGLTFMKAAPSNGTVTFESLVPGVCSVITSGVVVRRESLIEAGLFDPDFMRSEDLHLWLRLAHAGHNLTYQRQVIARHRVHHDSLSANQIRMFESKIQVFKKLERELPLTAQQKQLLKNEIRRCNADISFHKGKEEFEQGKYGDAVKTLRIANDFYRSYRLRLILLGLSLAPGLLRWAYQLRHGSNGNSSRDEADKRVLSKPA